MSKKLVYLFSFLLSFTVYTHSDEVKEKDKSNDQYSKYAVGISYFGNMLWNPGFKCNIEYTLWEKIKEKSRLRKGELKTKIRKRELLLLGNIGFYSDPSINTNLFTAVDIAYRRVGTRRNYWQLQLGPGYFRSFFPETYEVNSDDSVEKVKFPGRSYFAPALSMGYGKELQPKRVLILKNWFVKIGSIFLLPYNNTVLPLLNFEVGCTLHKRKNRTLGKEKING